MTLIGVFWTTHDESRPLQHKDASRHEPASVCSNIDINIKHQMMHFTFDFTFILTETFIVDWHFLCPPFMALPTIEKIDTLAFFTGKVAFRFQIFNFFYVCFHTWTLFVYLSQSHSPEWLLYFLSTFSQFRVASLCSQCSSPPLRN